MTHLNLMAPSQPFHLQMVDCEGNVALYTLKTM